MEALKVNTMKLLFFDDEKHLYSSVWKDFSFCWTRTYPQIVIEHQPGKDYFYDYRAVRDVISSSINQYQIFFVDLLVPSDEQNSVESKIASGLDLIELAKQNPNCVIVAITSTAIKKYPKLKEDAFEAGADLVIVRTEFDKGMTRYRELCSEIYEKCVDKNIVEDEIPLEKEDNPKLDFIISQIGENNSQKGENNIRSLYKKALPGVTNMSKMKIEYLAPGLSGAFVLKMCAFEEGQPTATHLLKINQDVEMLKREIDNRPLLGRYKGLFINYLQTKDNLAHLPKAGRWFAICAVFENDSLTLRDWLNEPRDVNEISEVLKTIFYREREGLAVGYSELIPRRSIIGKGLNLTASRLPRIIMSLEELKEIWSHPQLGNDLQTKNKYDEIENFLLKKGEFWGEADLSFAPCHGDFHTRNILIDIAGFPKPTIIDTAEFGSYHWSTDYVRLIVDLILTSYDFGVESQLWKHLPKWISISEAIINSQVINDPNKDNESVRFAINWLIENFSQIFFFINSEDDFKQLQWELQLSLAVEFLRAAYRTDLSTPKRVLALQSGYFALIEASRSFKFKK
jgi:hypothetical protein